MKSLEVIRKFNLFLVHLFMKIMAVYLIYGSYLFDSPLSS